MKTITTILLLIMVLGCSAQEPDTIICYDQDDMDLKDLLLSDTIDYFNEVVSERNEQIALRNDSINLLLQQIAIKDSIILNNLTEISVFADTFNFELVDDIIKVEVNKLGHDVSVYLFNDVEMTKIEYLNNERTIILTDSVLWRP